MEVVFSPKALGDIKYWEQSGNVGVQKKIKELLQAIRTNPFAGVGKPEALKYDLAGKWSRRVNHEHRIVYGIAGNVVTIYSLRGHY